MTDGFTHLHVHTEYSMLDGAAKHAPLFAEAKRLGMSALAMTDHGNVFGAFSFYRTAQATGIKPIIGMEAYCAPLGRFHKQPVAWGHPGQRDDDVSAGGAYTHLTLLARNAVGLRNIFRLSSIASLEGFYRKPRTDKELLAQYAEGIIATTGCASGAIATRLRLGQRAEALQEASDLRDIFGPGNVYGELMDHGIDIERRTYADLLEIMHRLDLPPLATNDSHYVTRDQAGAHELLLALQSGKEMADPTRFHFDGDGYYLKSAGEMRAIWDERVPGACDNTTAIADSVESYADVFARRNLMPRADVPDGETAESWLNTLARKGMDHYWPGWWSNDTYRERLDYELDVINGKGFAGYFLVVADLVRYAKSQGIAVGPGRGSATGSMVSFALGITALDPIEHGLMFERMLNPERDSMPDIDLDFDERRRGDMIRYVTEKYGDDHVCQIITFNMIKAKAALKDAGRVLGMPYALGDRMTKAFPPSQMGRDIDLATITDPAQRRYAEALSVREILQAEPEARRVYEAARGIEGLIRQAGVHAAGVIISAEPLLDVLPIWRRDDGSIVSGFDFNDCDALGLLKMDFLGLRNLSAIDQAVANIHRTSNPDLALSPRELEDDRTYELLARGDTLGVFQLDAAPLRRLLQSMRPTDFNDIVATIALYRPGPMGANAHNDYADRKNGRKPVVPIHPELAEPLADILGDTYGLIVYQEHVLAIAQRVAGYSLGTADLLRKAMGKKKPEILAREYANFQAGMQANGYSAGAIKALWDTLLPFASYGFGLAHSSGYAILSYWTAYLKANYPAEYMAALLTTVGDDKTKMALYLSECRRLDISVLPPDVNASADVFVAEKGTIRFGLGAVRNVGANVVAAIVDARDDGPYTGFYDFLRRVDAVACNKKAVESLIKAGAFDSMGHTRRGLMAVHAEAVNQFTATKRQEDIGQFDISSLLDNEGDQDASLPPIPTYEWDKADKLALERGMLGMYVSDHPLLGMQRTIECAADAPLSALDDDQSTRDGITMKFAGILSDVQRKMSRAGKTYATATIEDLTGSASLLLFATALEHGADAYLAEDAIVVATCRIDRSEDTPRLMVIGMAAPGEPPSLVTIALTAEQCTPRLAARLRDTLSEHAGDTELCIHLLCAEKTIQLRTAARVTPSPALDAAVRELLRGE